MGRGDLNYLNAIQLEDGKDIEVEWMILNSSFHRRHRRRHRHHLPRYQSSSDHNRYRPPVLLHLRTLLLHVRHRYLVSPRPRRPRRCRRWLYPVMLRSGHSRP